MKSFGHRLPKCPARSFHKKVVEHIPASLWVALGPILEQIGSLTERIRDYDRRLEVISKEHYPQTDLLGQVEGVGTLTALTFVLTLEDPYRFQRSRSVGAYLGLVPARDHSGDRDPQKRISKEGDEMLRRLLVGSAHYILGPFGSDSDLRRHGQKLWTCVGSVDCFRLRTVRGKESSATNKPHLPTAVSPRSYPAG